MSDWLSEFEENDKVLRDLAMEIDSETPRERMARVIREFAKFLPAFRDIRGGNPAVDLEILFEAYKNLSPDAKEIIGELAE